VEGVRRELELFKREHKKVVAERGVFAERFETGFGATAGKIPSAGDLMREYTDETVDSLLNIVLEEMGAVGHVAVRSGSLKTTFKGRLRAASRRAVAASKLLFTRATIRVTGDREVGALDQARCELRAARDLVEEAQEKIRRLEEEVRLLKTKETFRAYRAKRASPPPCCIPPFEADTGGDAMEVEESPPGMSPSREDPPKERISVMEGPPMDPAPSLDLVERIVERVLGRLRPLREALGQPSTPPRPPPAGGREPWSRVVERKAKGRVTDKLSLKETVIPPPPPTPGRKRRKKKKKKQRPSKGSAGSQSASKVGQTSQKKRKTPRG